MTKKIQFRAFIPPIMSAIRTGGDSMRLTFDVPESDLQDAVALIALRDTPLRITVEVDQGKVATKPNGSKKELNAYSLYWKGWFKPNGNGAAAIYSTVLADSLRLDGEAVTHDSVHDALKAALGVHSLSREASPEHFEAWLSERHLDGLVALSHQISARLQEAR